MNSEFERGNEWQKGDPSRAGHGVPGDPQPDATGSGTAPSMPFSITITIKIEGYATCPPKVSVDKC